MSYEKVRSINIVGDKVMINSACNNVRPLLYETWECIPLTKTLKEKGKDAVELEIFKAYESGEFQAGSINKYVRAVELLLKVYADEYEKFNWRTGSLSKQEVRNSKEFDDLLIKVLRTRNPKPKYVGFDKTRNLFILKTTSRFIKYTSDKKYAKLFRFKNDILGYNKMGFNFEVMESD